jgi:hypothetical protein
MAESIFMALKTPAQKVNRFLNIPGQTHLEGQEDTPHTEALRGASTVAEVDNVMHFNNDGFTNFEPSASGVSPLQQYQDHLQRTSSGEDENMVV